MTKISLHVTLNTIKLKNKANATYDDISVIYMTAQMCKRTEDVPTVVDVT